MWLPEDGVGDSVNGVQVEIHYDLLPLRSCTISSKISSDIYGQAYAHYTPSKTSKIASL